MTYHISIPRTQKRKRPKITVSTLAVLAMSFATLSTSSAFAQDEARQFSAKTGESVNQALELGSKTDFQAALSVLNDVIEAQTLNPYEASTVFQMVGQYQYEMGQSVEAQGAFQQAINAGGLLPEESGNLKVIIAQLMIGNGQYREGAEALEIYLQSGGAEKPQYTELLVNAWVQDEGYARALPWAVKWFDSAAPKTRRHYDLMNFLYHTLDMKEEQGEIVRQMVKQWPDDKALWTAWGSLLENDTQ